MPKCSGPTFWTRGWMTPLGFCRTSWGRDRDRLRLRVVTIAMPPKRVRNNPILKHGSPEFFRDFFDSLTKTPIPGDAAGRAPFSAPLSRHPCLPSEGPKKAPVLTVPFSSDYISDCYGL